MAKFINPFTDIGFKRIFGQEISKPLIIDFLNSLLLGEERITNITFLDKEQPALFEGNRLEIQHRCGVSCSLSEFLPDGL